MLVTRGYQVQVSKKCSLGNHGACGAMKEQF
jgi:hypothetical protein